MAKEFYTSPSSEVIGICPAEVIASSPYNIEDISSSGNVVEWEWGN